MTRVLILTTEPLPYRGMPTTGAGLRAWGLAEGLRACGLDVSIAMPAETIEGRTINDPAFSADINIFKRPFLMEFINKINPDVLVFQHWGLMEHLQGATCPLALDLAGPHLLERYYWSDSNITSSDEPAKVFSTDYEKNLSEKLRALRLADFITCSGTFQRHYFLPFLAMTGWHINSGSLPVIPFSINPVPPEGRGALERQPDTFVYGGMFLPWQNPEKPLRWLLEVFDEFNRGTLLFFGGMHPTMDVSQGKFEGLLQHLSKHPRVVMKGMLPFDELCKEYIQASAALDLCEQNPERELAFTTRTAVYLWCGLPVIYNNYSELSGYIEKADAGWCLDPEDEKTFKQTIRDILNNNTSLEEKRRNAENLCANKLDWTKTIKPLADFCLAPFYREGKSGVLLAAEYRTQKMSQLEMDLEQTRRELLTLKGKMIFKFYERASLFRPLLALIIFIIALPLCLLMLLLLIFSDIFRPAKGKSKKVDSQGQ
ncbi:MAG TPA: glycosyltransferase family 4 protein [Candidatus Sumerlaeota bacterium]|nr:glycosyltransferase family 4 protein [Candidatus Sumerlaeota bacterium]HON49850.1 glycosyltransferase family 4 protein [Candidatus Sumerlaeota bacterium]HOR63902.1 glycosyltransferase family 4 protein [Candidatus Sumerlaeota bacterium]HPL75050.1 glycosyltransferase family 4 protein [Candidatus Sumerlaeota bacterium]HRU54524.1 glycosyltransferase family 4 protein [Candidatus Sumerlaeia bacterium]